MAMGKITLLDMVASYTGQPVAILCSGNWYRGILREVGTDYVVLEPARAVADPGPLNADRPKVEYPIPSSVIVGTSAIALLCQPAWAWFEMPVVRPPRR